MKYKEHLEAMDDFQRKWEEECRELLLKLAREWGPDAAWDKISEQLKPKDLDFIREFHQYINWEYVKENTKINPKIQKEFGEEIDKSWKENIDERLKMLEAMIRDIY